MSTQKRVFIIHGWDGYPEEGIFPWLKPEIKTWVAFLAKQVGVPNENTFFFGHSIGAQTILRYLESLPENMKVGGAVFLAGWTNLTNEAYETEEDHQIAKPWLETPLDWKKIKTHTNKFVGIFSEDDPLVPFSESTIFANNLGAKIIIEQNKEHFSGNGGIKELLSALESVLEIAGEKK
jgi:predicted alpha/beta hydrolase family esterase